MTRTPHRHDRDAGGDAELLAAKAALRDEVWIALTDAGVSRADAAISELLIAEAALLDTLPPPDRDQLAALLRTLSLDFDGTEHA